MPILAVAKDGNVACSISYYHEGIVFLANGDAVVMLEIIIEVDESSNVLNSIRIIFPSKIENNSWKYLKNSLLSMTNQTIYTEGWDKKANSKIEIEGIEANVFNQLNFELLTSTPQHSNLQVIFDPPIPSRKKYMFRIIFRVKKLARRRSKFHSDWRYYSEIHPIAGLPIAETGIITIRKWNIWFFAPPKKEFKDFNVGLVHREVEEAKISSFKLFFDEYLNEFKYKQIQSSPGKYAVNGLLYSGEKIKNVTELKSGADLPINIVYGPHPLPRWITYFSFLIAIVSLVLAILTLFI
ncbi:MAG: hypothetical protein ACFFAH_05000 [Promethearchaeota archaeon]